MSKNINQVLIVSEAGRLRDSLRVLLKSCYPLATIEETETFTAALQRLAADPGALVLVDAALPGEQTDDERGHKAGHNRKRGGVLHELFLPSGCLPG